MAVVKLVELPKIRSRYKNEKIVFATGTFDLFHAGHVLFLEKCKKYGDILVVGIGKDTAVKSYKGNDRPILSQYVRLKIVDSVKPAIWLPFDRAKELPGYIDLIPHPGLVWRLKLLLNMNI